MLPTRAHAFFFAGWIFLMELLLLLLLPETKTVPMDAIVDEVRKQHPVWKKFMD